LQSRIEERFFVTNFDNVKIKLNSNLKLLRKNYVTTMWFSFNKEGKKVPGQLRIRFYDFVSELKPSLKCFLEFKMLGMTKERNLKERKQFRYSDAVNFIRNPVKLKGHFFFASTFSNKTKLDISCIKSCLRHHYVLNNISPDEFRVTLDSEIKFYDINKRFNKLTENEKKFPGCVCELKYNKDKKEWAKWFRNLFIS